MRLLLANYADGIFLGFIAQKIFLLLDDVSLYKAEKVSKVWKKTIIDGRLWEKRLRFKHVNQLVYNVFIFLN